MVCRTRSASAVRSVNVEMECCRDVFNLDLRDIRAHHIKSCMDMTKSPKYKKGIRFIFQEVLSMGMEYGAVTNNVARDYSPKISQEGKKEVSDHTALTQAEMDILWENINSPIHRAILIQCYTGFRPDELCKVLKTDVHFEQGYIIGGNKTEAGRNRVVPICEKIREVVRIALENPTDHLIATAYRPYKYNNCFDNLYNNSCPLCRNIFHILLYLYRNYYKVIPFVLQ